MEIETLHVPFHQDEQGVLRIGATRITLDIVVAVFKQGATPEEIVQDFPTLHLADVYAVLAYYLQHRESVEQYLQQRHDEAVEMRTRMESRTEVQNLRARLRARP